MGEQKEIIPDDVDCSTNNVCAILGNFTSGGINVIYKNIQANVLNFQHVSLDLEMRDENKAVKRGKYVR